MKKFLFTNLLLIAVCFTAFSQTIPPLKFKTHSLRQLPKDFNFTLPDSLFDRRLLEAQKFRKDSVPSELFKNFDPKNFDFKHPYQPPFENNLLPQANNLPVITPPKSNYSLIVVVPDTTVQYFIRQANR